MGIQPRTIVRLLVKAGLAALVANEIRGLILAGPVLYGLYQAGGTAMAVWVAFCSLAGIAISVFVPLLVARKFKLV
jgi:hypothetical protein